MDLSSTPLTPAETLFRLCQLWTVLHNRSSPIPSICKGVGSPTSSGDRIALQEFETYLRNNEILDSIEDIDEEHTKRPHAMNDKGFFERSNKEIRINNYRYTTRSLSVIGVLGGIVLILLITALSACVRHRRNLLIPMYSGDQGHDTFARAILIDQLRHLHRSRQSAAAREPPPSYDDVVKPPEAETSEEAEPPSYMEATASASMSASASTTVLVTNEEPSSSEDVQVTVNGQKVGQTVVHIESENGQNGNETQDTTDRDSDRE